eukprot:CFRG1858T1
MASRTDKVSAKLGPALLAGDTMLSESCFDCGTVLMRSQLSNRTYCVLCQDNKVDIVDGNSNDTARTGINPAPQTTSKLPSSFTQIPSETASDQEIDSPAEILRKRRDRKNQINDLIGSKMLEGFTMLSTYCPACTTVLLYDNKNRRTCCFGCTIGLEPRAALTSPIPVVPSPHTSVADASTSTVTNLPVRNCQATAAQGPPSQSDVHVEREARGERAAQKIGDALLAGNIMLHKACDSCGTVLLRDSKRKEFCVLCTGTNDLQGTSSGVCSKDSRGNDAKSEKVHSHDQHLGTNAAKRHKLNAGTALCDHQAKNVRTAVEASCDSLMMSLSKRIQHTAEALFDDNLSDDRLEQLTNTAKTLLSALNETHKTMGALTRE